MCFQPPNFRPDPIPLKSPLVSPPVIDEKRTLNHTTYATTDVSSHDPNMTPQQLPAEIVLRILDLANAPSSDSNLLKSCSLVCKAWSPHAQKMLFRSVSISTHSGYASLLAAFKPHAPCQDRSNRSATRGSRAIGSSSISLITTLPVFFPISGAAYSTLLRRSVVELNMIIDFNQPDGLTFTEFSHIVSLCPNIQRVGISVFGTQRPGRDVIGATDQLQTTRWAPSITDGVVEELRAAPNVSKVSGLRFNNWSDNSGILIQLLGIWPHITSLELSGKLPTINDGIDSAFPTVLPGAAPCRLEALSVNCATDVESNVDFIKWLLAGSQYALRRLKFLKEPSGKLLEDIFDNSTFPLESVYLPSCASPAAKQIIQRRFGSTVASTLNGDKRVPEDHPFIRAQDLKELFVEDPSTPLTFLLSAIRSETVQSFGFGVNGLTDVSFIARVIKARTRLKRVAVWIGDGGESNVGLGSLRIACAIRGIELEETRDVKEFRAWRA